MIELIKTFKPEVKASKSDKRLQTLVSPKICKREIIAVFLRICQITTVIFCKFDISIVVLSPHIDKGCVPRPPCAVHLPLSRS